MSVLIVDTSSWIEYFRGEGNYEILENSLADGTLYLPLPVAGELLSGRLTKKRRLDLEKFLYELPLIGTELSDWKKAGALRANLAEKGLACSMIDTFIASCVIEHNGFLMSKDKIFYKIKKLVKLNLV